MLAYPNTFHNDCVWWLPDKRYMLNDTTFSVKCFIVHWVKKGAEIAPLGELFACNSTPLVELFWCHFRGRSGFFSLVFIFRNGARGGSKIVPFAEREPFSNKVLKKVGNGARWEAKQCQSGTKIVPFSKKKGSCFQPSFWKTVPLRRGCSVIFKHDYKGKKQLPLPKGHHFLKRCRKGGALASLFFSVLFDKN